MLKVIGGVPDGEYKAIASGTLPSGKPVVVNSDGTVSVVSSLAASVGTASDAGFAGGNGLVVSRMSDTKFVAACQHDSTNTYGTAIIGTLSGSTISFGTKQVVASVAYPEKPNVVGLTDSTFVYVYKDGTASNVGKAVVCTVSGTTISVGSTVTFEGGQTDLNTVNSVTRLTDTTFLIAFTDSSDSGRSKAIVGTVSGSSVSFGSPATFSGTNTLYTTVSALSSTKVAIAWSDTASTEIGKVVIGTISGTSISYGSTVTYDSSRIVRHSIAALSDSKFVIAYEDDRLGNQYGTAVAGTVSGTTITLGTSVVFRSAALGNSYPAITNIDADNFAIAYRGDSAKGTIIQGTTSGTDITFADPIVFSAGTSTENWTALVGSKVIIGYDQTNFTAIAYSPPSSTLTAENYIGMSKGVVEQTTVAQAAGTPVTFESALSRYTGAAYDANTQKIVIAYQDNGNLNYGTAVVGTVNASNNSISFGTPVVFEAAEVAFTTITYDANAQKVVIGYEDQGNSQYGTAVVGTVSGTSISFGTPVVFNSGAVAEITSTYDANAQKIVLSYYDQSQNHGEAVIGTVSGTSISFGTPVDYKTNAIGSNSITYDSTNQKVVIVFRNSGGDLSGKAVVGTVSGTSISFGSETTFSTQSPEYLSVSYDSNNQKIVIAYTASSNSSYGTAIVGTVSGTAISFGSASVFNTSTTAFNSIGYDANAQRVVISYRDSGNSLYGTAVAGEVSGSSITFNTPTVFQTGRTQEIGTAYDTNAQKIVLSYWDYAASTGDAVVFQAGYTSTDRSPVADGDPARVDIIGSVSDNQLSLTAGEKYYVQTDGTISTTAGDPSVLAGTAISATKLVVKT